MQTEQVLNTTSLWDGPYTSPNLRYTILNFTLNPPLALDLNSSGTGSINLWVTVSGAPGNLAGTLNATIYDVNSAGQVAVVTTSIGVTNSTSPTTPYEVTIPFSLNHLFSASSTIRLSLTASKVGQLYLYYDSAVYPAVVTLSALRVPWVSLIELFDWTLNRETRFNLNWTASQRVVFANIHIADPFGAYDVVNVTVSVLDPGSRQIFTVGAQPFAANPGSPEKLFGLNWPYAQSALPGNYTISVLAYNLAGNQASGSARLTLSYSNPPSSQPPGTQPPSTPVPFPYPLVAFGLVTGLLALLLLAFLFLRRKEKCPKCGARVNPKLAACPNCGSPLKPAK